MSTPTSPAGPGTKPQDRVSVIMHRQRVLHDMFKALDAKFDAVLMQLMPSETADASGANPPEENPFKEIATTLKNLSQAILELRELFEATLAYIVRPNDATLRQLNARRRAAPAAES